MSHNDQNSPPQHTVGAYHLKDTWEHTSRKLLKLYEIVEVGNKEFIKPTEYIDDDVLIAHIGMAIIIKNNRERKINDTKYEDI